jgi:hypothetical protein
MPETSEGTKVTAQDVATGDNESVVIVNDYVCTTDGTCHVAHVQAFANGTHVLTIKGRERTGRDA